jgi:oligopeptide transport system substrate-binding protein
MRKIFFLFTLTVFLWAGSRFYLATEESPPESKEAPQEDFVIALLKRNFSLNPFKADEQFEFLILDSLFEGLVAFHPVTFEPIPACALRWEIAEGGRVYRFYLREEAKFSSGDTVRALDFQESWIELLRPETKGAYASYFDIIQGAYDFRTGKNKDPKSVGIKAVSEHVLEVKLVEPASYFLKLLSMVSFCPTHVVNRVSNDWEKATSIIGNGPFQVKAISKDSLVLKKNKNYWDAKNVRLSSITFQFYNNEEDISQEYNQRRVHWAFNWDFKNLNDKSSIVVGKKFATMYYFFICKNPPWNDERVRRGLALLLPWKELRKDNKFPTSIFVPNIPGYPAVKGIEVQNIDEGLNLLKQAGFPKGQGLPEIIILQEKGFTEKAELMAKTWRENLKVKVTVKEAGEQSFFEDLKLQNYTLSSWVWLGDFPDPAAFLMIYASKSNLNNTVFSDSEYDALLKESLALKGGERYKKLAEAEALLLKKAVVLPIYHAVAYDLIDLDQVQGWYANPFDYHPLKYIELKDPKMIQGIVKR